MGFTILISLFLGFFRKTNIFGVQNFEFHYFLGFSEKQSFWGYENFVDIFLGHHKVGLHCIFSGHFYAFYGLFLRARYRMEDIFWVGKISNIFWGCLKFHIFFWGER